MLKRSKNSVRQYCNEINTDLQIILFKADSFSGLSWIGTSIDLSLWVSDFVVSYEILIIVKYYVNNLNVALG